MLGMYPMVVPPTNGIARKHAELARYVRWEYGPQADVAAFLAEVAKESTKARTKGHSRVTEGVRAIASAFRSLAARRSRPMKAEG